MSLNSAQAGRSELAAALGSCRTALFGIAIMSAVLNVLMLGGSFFMLLVYDTVLPSRSIPTLVGLLIFITIVYIFQSFIDQNRSRMLIQIGANMDVTLGGRVYEVISRYGLRARASGDGLQPVRDLDQIRNFMSSAGPTAMIDLPWMVLFLAILFMFHTLIGLTALVGAIILIALTFATDRMTRKPTENATKIASWRNAMAESSRRNAEVLYALGMSGRAQVAWSNISAEYLIAQQRVADVAGSLGSFSKTLRLLLQSATLAVGAYLVIDGKASGGVIVASSILVARALAPVEQAIANWKGFVAARQSWARLSELLRAFPADPVVTQLPRPKETLQVEALTLGPPGVPRVTVQDVSFSLKAGDALGVVGPSASGKSSLIRALVGVWTPLRGAVRLDGATFKQWSPDALGVHLGYLPQDVELLEGTIAQNIARFEPDAPTDMVLAAAQNAGVHELILRLPEGYETPVGPNGAALSAGQRQRVALARALYRDPFLVVLDEPNSNLDSEGEAALTRAISGARARGAIVIVVAHRPSALSNVDLVLFMMEGRAQAFGPKNEVLPRILAQHALPRPPEAGAKPAAAAAAQ